MTACCSPEQHRRANHAPQSFARTINSLHKHPLSTTSEAFSRFSRSTVVWSRPSTTTSQPPIHCPEHAFLTPSSFSYELHHRPRRNEPHLHHPQPCSAQRASRSLALLPSFSFSCLPLQHYAPTGTRHTAPAKIPVTPMFTQMTTCPMETAPIIAGTSTAHMLLP